MGPSRSAAWRLVAEPRPETEKDFRSSIYQFSVFRSLLLALLLASLTTFLPSPVRAQSAFSGTLRNFRFPDYYPLSSPTQTVQVLKTLLNGAEARQLPDGKVQITGLRIESFREDGRPEFEVRAAECLFHTVTHEASGAGRLTVSNTAGLYAIEGEGFLWRQSEGALFISNRVVSTLNRGLLASRTSLTSAPPALANFPTGQVIRITSDRCAFSSQANIVTHSGRVTTDDPQMQLTCETLKVQFTSAKRPKEVVAEEDVSILNKADQSRATGGRAVYVVTPEKETMTLLENPSWRDRDGRQEVKAGLFTYDLRNRSIRAEGQPAMRLPHGSAGQPGFLSRPAVPAATNVPSTTVTNIAPIEISSSVLTILLPATNRLHRSAIAESNVVILSPADNTRATGDKAVFTEATGTLELSGRAQWNAQGRTVSADTLVMDRTNRVFTGHGHTFFRLPLSQMSQAGFSAAGTNRIGSTNLFLEITADDMAYQTNHLSFRTNVQTRFLEGFALRGVVTCEKLTAQFTDRLESLLAERHVLAEHYPPAGGRSKGSTNLLSSQVLSARVSPSGDVVALVAAGHVQTAQIAWNAKKPRPTITEMTCGILTALLLPQSGQVDNLYAEDQVMIAQGDKIARGDNAIYKAEQNVFELTGKPYAEFAEGRVKDADVLLWDRDAGTFKGRGKYRIEWTQPPGRTNRVSFFPPLK